MLPAVDEQGAKHDILFLHHGIWKGGHQGSDELLWTFSSPRLQPPSSERAVSAVPEPRRDARPHKPTGLGGEIPPGASSLPAGGSLEPPGEPPQGAAPALAAGAHIPGAFHGRPATREPGDQPALYQGHLTRFGVPRRGPKPPGTHRLVALSKEQALFRASGARLAREAFRWQVM